MTSSPTVQSTLASYLGLLSQAASVPVVDTATVTMESTLPASSTLAPLLASARTTTTATAANAYSPAALTAAGASITNSSAQTATVSTSTVSSYTSVILGELLSTLSEVLTTLSTAVTEVTSSTTGSTYENFTVIDGVITNTATTVATDDATSWLTVFENTTTAGSDIFTVNSNYTDSSLRLQNVTTTAESYSGGYDNSSWETTALSIVNATAATITTMGTYINTSDIFSVDGVHPGGDAQYRFAPDQILNGTTGWALGNVTGGDPGTSGVQQRPPGHYACLVFDFFIEAVFMGFLCAFGFTGNTLSMICLWRDRSKTATPFLLVSLELADTLFLVTVLFLRVLTSIHGFTGWLGSIMSVFPYIGTYFYAFALIAETGSIYLTILVTVNRYVSVCRPYEASNLCSIYHARRHVVFVTLFSVIFNLPRFFEYSVVQVIHPATNQTMPRAMMTDFARNIFYQVIYANVLYFLVMFAVPLVTLVCLNYKLIKALRKTKKKRAQLISSSHLDSQSRSEDDITLVLIVVVIVFVISQTPALITQSLMSFLPEPKRLCPSAFFYYERVSDLMVVANASMNFIIYCFCSTKFRQILKNLLCKRELDSPEQSENMTKVTKVRIKNCGRSTQDSMV